MAPKHYYTVLNPVLQKNIKALRNFIRQYHPEDMEKIYEGLSVERKELIDESDDVLSFDDQINILLLAIKMLE